MKLSRARNETEVQELLRLHGNKTMSVESDAMGNLISVETNDSEVELYAKGRGLK